MLKTNSKIVKERIKKYIMDNFMFDNYKNDGIDEPTTFSEIAKFIWKCYEDEKYYPNGMVREQDNFADWLQGLPSVLYTGDYCLNSAVDLLGGILEETESEKARFGEMDAVRLMNYLIYREIRNEVRK